jgi:3,4-dihydroxy 2-butanone 4-phosphate synthase/GTP cyclohydrolase II
MRLADFLKEQGIRRGKFARDIGVSPGRVTQLCDGRGWPSRDVAEKISVATGGRVTADDFLADEDAEVRA